jgi:hypothetical protein
MTVANYGQPHLNVSISDPRRIDGLPPTIERVYATPMCSFALDNSGNLWSWGTNYNGLLGRGQILAAGSQPPQQLVFPTGQKVKQFVITQLNDYISALALMDDYTTLYTWGTNSYYEPATASVQAPYFDIPTPVYFPPTNPGQDSQIIGSIFAGGSYFGAVTTMSYITPWLQDERFWSP